MDKVAYLNVGNADDILFSRLLRLLVESKQARARPAQWLGLINGFTQKGVKKAEIDDCQVLHYLQSCDPGVAVDQQSLVTFVSSRMPLIKRVDLGSPGYKSYTSINGERYVERLYILSSEAMRADDEIEALIYEIEELGFDPAPLLKDPSLVERLTAKMSLLRENRPEMYDFQHHHFDEKAGRHGKNLMAHARFLRQGGLFFVQEVQSDWAQGGRANNWQAGFPRAPFVTDTEQWAGVVLRDLLSEAALDRTCRSVAWIRGDMRNGWDKDRARIIGSDDLGVFYDSIVRKIVAKAIGKAGSVGVREVSTRHGRREVLGFDMTDAVRDVLRAPLPLYSRDDLLTGWHVRAHQDPDRLQERSAVVAECTQMIGDQRLVRFVEKVYDVATGAEVAGKYLHAGIGACTRPSIQVSLRAKDLQRAARHEMWHFAHENLLYEHERRVMRLEFSEGAPLHERTRSKLVELGLNAAAEQCRDHRECAAHAFSLWMAGDLAVEDRPAGIFGAVVKTVENLGRWLTEKLFGVEVRSPDELFEAMRSGALRQRQDGSPEDPTTQERQDPSPAPGG